MCGMWPIVYMNIQIFRAENFFCPLKGTLPLVKNAL